MKLKKWSRRILIGFLFFATFIALFYAEEDWRGARDWTRVEKELRAKGEPLTLDKILPASIPDNENVAAAPIFKELWTNPKNARLSQLKLPGPLNSSTPAMGDSMSGEPMDLLGWQKLLTGKSNPQTAAADILTALSKYDPILQDLDQALQRPKVLWPMSRDKPLEGFMINIGFIIPTCKILTLKGGAALALGKTDLALLNLKRIYRLNRAVENYSLFGQIVAQGGDYLSLPLVQEGINTHRWSDAQLTEIQKILLTEDFLASYKAAYRMERALFNHASRLVEGNRVQLMSWITIRNKSTANIISRFCSICLSLLPAGWGDQDRTFYNQTVQTYFLDPIDPKLQRVDSMKIQAADAYVRNGNQLPGYHLFSTSALRFLGGVSFNSAQTQTRINLGAIACGLERYRLAHGKLPDSLQALVPDYIPQLPHDLITGTPINYKRVSDQDYVLYSTGWDCGIVDKKQGDRWDLAWPSLQNLDKIK